MLKLNNLFRRTLFLSLLFVAVVAAMGQTKQTKKQSLPEQPGFVLQDGTVYTVDKTMTLDGNSTGGFINGLAVADGATVTLYIPAGVTFTVKGQNADGQHGAGAGIYVPSNSTLYITGEGKLVAKGGDGGNGGDGANGGDGNISGQLASSGAGGAGGYGGGGAAAAIGGNGGNGGETTAGAISLSARRRSEGQNGLPSLPTSTDYNGKDGYAGASMGNVYILGSVTVETTQGSAGTAGGAAGVHGTANTKNNKNELWAGGGGAGAGGGAGYGATYGIGGGAAGAGGGAAGGSGAADSRKANKFTSSDNNAKGNASSASGYGEGAVNGAICDDTNTPRDNGGVTETEFLRYGGYGGSVGGKAGAQGGNGDVYIEHDSEANLDGATIGHLVTLQESQTEEALAALNVNIKLNFLNDGDPNSGVLTAKFGEYYTQLASELIPTRPGYDFVGYFTQAVGGDQMFDKDGKPATTGARCLYVQEENPTLYAHWILSTYTITWKYDYYSVDEGGMVEIPAGERSYKANVIIRLTDGTTHTMVMENPTPSQTETTYTVTLKNELDESVFNKVVSVDRVEPVEVGGSTNKVLMTLDYVTESSAKIFYDPTRYMVKWNVSVDAKEKPEYIILSVKRGTTDATADGDIPTTGTYAEDANIFQNIRIRQNASGTYSGSAVLMYEQDASNAFHYSVSVVGVRDDSGHEYMFPTAVSSKDETNGIMYCSKPSEQNPNPKRNIDEIQFNVNLKQLTFDPNGGTLDDGSPENIWAPTNTSVALKDGSTYPYTATRLNYNFEGWNTVANATVGLDNITLDNDNTVYAVFMDRTPPTITFGDHTRNGSGNNYQVPITISDAISTENVVYYAVYDNNPGDIPANDSRWGSEKGKTTKKAEVVKIDFTTTSVVYVHVKAVDESGNAAVASKEIKVDTEAPVIRTYPNVDGFCKTFVKDNKGQNTTTPINPPVVDINDNAGVEGLSITISPNVTLNNILDDMSAVVGKTATLPWPNTGSVAYTFTATDAAGNQTVRTITVYAEHDWDNGSDIAATEPTATTEGAYRYRKCAHCSHIVLLRGDKNHEIDMTDETQRTSWIIPVGAVMVMEPWNGGLDIVDHGTYVNDALGKANSNTDAVQVRLSKDTQVANNNNVLYNLTRKEPVDIELNGHGLLQSNGLAGDITGNPNVTILLSDGNNRGKAAGHTKEYATDIIPYTNKSSVTGSPIKYTRVFSSYQSNNVWQALYLPIAFTYTEEMAKKFALAEYKEQNDFTPETDGHIVIKVEEISAGKSASGPLFIGSKVSALEINLGTNLPAATPYSYNTKAGSGFNFIGTLYDSPVSAAENPFWVLLNNGNMWYAAAGQTQRPYRWVIQPTSGSGAKSITFQVVEPEADGIEEIEKRSENLTRSIYTIDGRKIPSTSALHPGIYIVNGKKMVIK